MVFQKRCEYFFAQKLYISEEAGPFWDTILLNLRSDYIEGIYKNKKDISHTFFSFPSQQMLSRAG